jgi:hypothetical protein
VDPSLAAISVGHVSPAYMAALSNDDDDQEHVEPAACDCIHLGQDGQI